MAANGEAPAEVPDGLAEALSRVANVMALTLVRRMEKPEKIRVLASLGYSHAEIAAFLDERTNTVAKVLSQQRAKAAGRKPAARKPTTRNGTAPRKRAATRKRKEATKVATVRRRPAAGRRSR